MGSKNGQKGLFPLVKSLSQNSKQSEPHQLPFLTNPRIITSQLISHEERNENTQLCIGIGDALNRNPVHINLYSVAKPLGEEVKLRQQFAPGPRYLMNRTGLDHAES